MIKANQQAVRTFVRTACWFEGMRGRFTMRVYSTTGPLVHSRPQGRMTGEQRA